MDAAKQLKRTPAQTPRAKKMKNFQGKLLVDCLPAERLARSERILRQHLNNLESNPGELKACRGTYILTPGDIIDAMNVQINNGVRDSMALIFQVLDRTDLPEVKEKFMGREIMNSDIVKKS